MRKILSVLLGSLVALMLVGCGSNVDDATADKYIEQAKAVVENLNNENYEDIQAQFDAKMKANLTTEQMAELAPIIEASGQFQEFDKQSVEEKDGYYTTILVAKYSEENRIYTISFNEQDEIVGLYIK